MHSHKQGSNQGFRQIFGVPALSDELGHLLFALYQGTTSVVPLKVQERLGFSPCHRKICTKFQGKKRKG
jgi:hypothetical protein